MGLIARAEAHATMSSLSWPVEIKSTPEQTPRPRNSIRVEQPLICIANIRFTATLPIIPIRATNSIDGITLQRASIGT